MAKLGTPDVDRIETLKNQPAPDAAEESVANGSPDDLKKDLEALIGKEQVYSRAIDLIRYASDASPYRYIPQVVVSPRNVDDMKAVLKYARDNGRHLTFRAGGTSLTGQSQSDDILVDARHNWYGIKIEDDAKKIRLRPGTVLDHANQALRPYRRRLGPDPASQKAANVGGVISNNSGGMRCHLERDSYHMVSAMTFVLPSGTTINTEDVDAEDQFMRAEPDLANGLMLLRTELLADTKLADRVRHKYKIRNTNGYQLRALLDGETPLEIFRRLVIGSSGTLAFVSEVVFDTLANPKHRNLGVILTKGTYEAAALIPKLADMGAEACEFMVGSSLAASTSVWPDLPKSWKDLPADCAGLLLEFREDSEETLSDKEAKVHQLIKDTKTELLEDLKFSHDEAFMELVWTMREGLAGVASRMRPPGTSIIIEDVCFPPKKIADAANDLQKLINKHKYPATIAGHAMYGNLHFQLAIDPADDGDRKVYKAFLEDLVKLVIDDYDGSLKAEHATGINMAPYVEDEWGSKAYEMMWRIKSLADPHNVLGRHVILSRDPEVNMRNFESTPAIEKVATECMECGFCEPVCPSRNVTLTPRQRILLRREMARQPADSAVTKALLSDYEYMGIETCAVDGTCETVCPVGINTGELIKGLRRDESTQTRERVALSMAKHWATAEHLSRDAVGAADIVQQTVGDGLLTGITEGVRVVISHDLMPSVPGPMPRPAPAELPKTKRDGAVAVYFPACVNRIFGRNPDDDPKPGLPEALVTVSERAGMPLWIPEDATGLCCATPWASKGYSDGHRYMSRKIVDAILKWTDNGRLPLVIDASSCTWGLVDEVPPELDKVRAEQFKKVELLDSTQWTKRLLPKLTIHNKVDRAAVHPTCSTTHLGVNDVLHEVVAALADEVYIPIGTTCCGTAGDRGLLHPELVESATREEKAGLDDTPAEAYLSANRTCEMGMLQATGKPYESFVYLLEELSRDPK